MKAKRNQALLAALAVIAVALCIRLLYLPHIKALPTFAHPFMDAQYHDNWAREVASGTLTKGEPFFRAPLYPYLLGLIYRLTGGSYLAPRLLHFLLGALTALVTYTLARKLLGRLAAAISGAVAAVYPVVIYFEGELLTETLFIFLIMVSLYCFALAVEKQKGCMWFAAGLALGGAVITRPTAAVFIPFAALGALLFAERRRLHAVLVLLGVVLLIVPVTAHNLAVSGEFIPLVWQGGLNFYLGNNAAANGWSATGPGLRKDWWGGYHDMIAIPRQELGREPRYTEVSDYWTHKGLDYIKRDPSGWTRLMLKKVALFWGSYEFPNNLDYNFMRLHSWVLRNPVISFATVAPFAVLGLIVLAPKFRRLYFLYAFFLAFFAGTVAFFVCSRYRAPGLPLMIVFAGGAVAWLVDTARDRRVYKLVGAVIVLGAAGAFVTLNPAGENLPGPAQSYTLLASYYREEGDLEEAEAYLWRAVDDNPFWGEAYEVLGHIAMERGDTEGALKHLMKAVEVEPTRGASYLSLAMLYLQRGDLQRARKAAEAAVRHAPYQQDNYSVLGNVEKEEGNMDKAREMFEKEIDLNPDNWRGYANLASLHDEAGDLEKAIEIYERAADLNPDEPDVALALVTAYTKAGREDRAMALLSRMGEARPETPVMKYNKAVLLQNEGKTEEARALYEEVLAADPSHEGALVNLGVIYARQGRDEEARALWERALEVNPDNYNARRNIDLIMQRPHNGD
jgi:tetratricopeptide (TPR) repeat protein/4-amino-4-deoxy-L-arabinose transferase-like glycosyltransferase